MLGVRFDGTSPDRKTSDRLGLPLSMLALDEAHDYGIFECHSSEPGEIHAVSHLCRPEIAVINRLAVGQPAGLDDTTVTRELGILESMSKDGWAVLNGDVPRLGELAKEADSRVLLVGRGSHCDVVANDVRSQLGELSFVVDRTRFRVPVWGRHHLHSALAAYAVGRIMNLSPDEIALGLSRFRPLTGRCEIVRRSDISVINDTCDCRASSMPAALELLRDFGRAKRRIVVCGNLSGRANAFDLHRRVGQAIVQTCGADLLVACGPCGRQVIDGARDAGMAPRRMVWCRRGDDVGSTVQAMVQPGDAVLVKGSRNASMEHVVDSLLHTASATLARTAA
jgi:UDP-N-acetylmuramoyl-tripeptide--D-alanyl-D-alanine ligase